MAEGEPALGDVVQDAITNYQGTVTARTEYLDDPTPNLRVTRADRDGKPEDVWFLEPRLNVLSSRSASSKATLGFGGQR